MDHPLPWLRYVDADDLGDQTIDFDDFKVRNDAMEKLGEVDGFIIDSDTGRPYYVVVDSGGWFKSKHFLLPIGQVRMDADNDALVTDLSKQRVNRFPGFDKDEFQKLSEDDLRRMNDEICTVCSVTEVSYSSSEPIRAAGDRPQFKQPNWWNANPMNPDRMGDRAFENTVEYPPTKVAPASSRSRATTGASRDQIRAQGNRGREAVRRDGGDVSPHFEGRAQPGDVIGVETGGENTHVGDTAEHENKRRRDAEASARKRD